MSQSAPVGVPAKWIAAAAVTAAAVAVWVTLRADFLAHPEWLALQKADFILGPVFVGLYWLRRRPASRFGWLLIAFGFFAGVPYILESSSDPVLFSLGVLSEALVFMGSLTLVLAFPTGRLDGRPERLLLAAGVVTVCVPFVVIALSSPALVPAGTISGCLAACPANGLMVFSPDTALAMEMVRIGRTGVLTIALATLALLIWRLVTGTPPRRRAFVIGAPVAVFFLLTLAAVRGMLLFEVDAPGLQEVLGWSLVVSRALIWYGFLLALIAAELFAGRVLRRLVIESLGRPSLGELEGMLQAPLGDPGLRLAFRRPDGDGRVDADGEAVALPDLVSGRVLTEVERDGQAATAIIHDAQLAEEPELLRAAGAVALLAQENAQLEAAWSSSLRELGESRRRIVAASESERRKLERDLHDGAQQRLLGVRVRLAIESEDADADPAVSARLGELEEELDEAIQELRDLAHGIFPSLLADRGLVPALRAVGRLSPRPVEVTGRRIGRYPPEIESAIYYCCLEALQNATKHAGPTAHVKARLSADDGELRLEVSDDGPGFDVAATHGGVGLRNMEDRLGAVHGRLAIVSSPGSGTLISGVVPTIGTR